MTRPTLIELCAGAAAVSLRWLRADARPPMGYQGGKRGYADRILRAMGLAPGSGGGADVVLCEPGPWGEAWDLWRTPAGRQDTIDRLWTWAIEDPHALWNRLRAAPVPTDIAERVATWTVLAFWSFGRKPVLATGERWRTHGFNRAEAYRREIYLENRHRWHPERSTGQRDRRLPDVIASLQALPDLSRVRVLRCRAEEVEPIPGAVVYIDPDYLGTTCAYGFTFPRPAVLLVAERWRAAGAAVAVSEAEPLALPGWTHLELGDSAGPGRTWSKQRREVLTISQPPMGAQRRAA